MSILSSNTHNPRSAMIINTFWIELWFKIEFECVIVNLIVLPAQFGWTHVTLLIVVTQSHLIIHNLFEGMIW